MQKPSLPEKDATGEKSVNTEAAEFRFQESVLSAAGLATMSTTPEGMITRLNDDAQKLLGYQVQEVIGKSWTLFHDQAELLKRAAALAGSGGKESASGFDLVVAHSKSSAKSNDWTLIRKDGSKLAVRLTVVPISEKEPAAGFAGIITDLTAQRRLQEQVAFSEEKFRLLAENISGAIYLCRNDESHSVIYLNDHAEAITGYKTADFLSGKITFSSIFHPEDKDMIVNTVNESLSARKSYHLRYRIRHASGEWRWVEETGVGVYQGDQVTMLEGFLYDITRQKEAEEKLQNIAEENLRFFNNPVNLNAVADFNGYLQRISPSWSRVLGWSEQELKSKPVMDFIHPDDVDTTREALRYISKTGKVHTFENRFACNDGTYRWLLWGTASDPNRRMIYASAIDISGRKKSEENILDSKSNLESLTIQLQEQNRRLDEFAHIISHNLRAPLKNIQALIDLLNSKSEIADYKLIFDKLKNVSKNLGETMNELMDALKARSQPQVELTEIRFKELLDKVVQSLEGELIVAEASVTFDFNGAPVIYYSKPYLESIFQNLLTNAIKYRAPNRKPKIHLQSSMKDNHVELQVTDNGQGIDMERFGDKLFGLHKTFHEHQEARGVGLFLVKTQIEALGGTISVESEVDKGTTFTIRFAARHPPTSLIAQ
ncbi:MAG TPA: PAS domain S-box protein [Chryseosolibacter sp.]|nr:PAS domain S-box protein [Chryseosolibacter sp.]